MSVSCSYAGFRLYGIRLIIARGQGNLGETMGESLVIPTLIPVLEVPPILPKMLDLVSVGTQVYAPIQ